MIGKTMRRNLLVCLWHSRTTSMQANDNLCSNRIKQKKLISTLRPRLKVERSLVDSFLISYRSLVMLTYSLISNWSLFSSWILIVRLGSQQPALFFWGWQHSRESKSSLNALVLLSILWYQCAERIARENGKLTLKIRSCKSTFFVTHFTLSKTRATSSTE